VIILQPARRNYCLTVKDLEADRLKDLERAQSLKTAAGGNIILCLLWFLTQLNMSVHISLFMYT